MKAKLKKKTIYYVSFDDLETTELDSIEYQLNRLGVECFEEKDKTIVWNDDLKINNINADINDYESCFKTIKNDEFKKINKLINLKKNNPMILYTQIDLNKWLKKEDKIFTTVPHPVLYKDEWLKEKCKEIGEHIKKNYKVKDFRL